MTLETILSQEMIQRLGWTLLHFVWQATAVMLLLAVLLAGLRKATANVRYMIACAALGLIVVLPIATITFVPVSTPPSIIRIESPPASVTVTVQPTIEETPLARVVEFEEPVKLESAGTAPAVPWTKRMTEKLDASLPYLVAGWLIGVFGLSLWHLGGWAQLQRLKKHMVKPVDASLQAKLNELAARLNVHWAVRLLESALVQVPTVVGWLRPVILLPTSALTGLSMEQLEALLAHELAHIRRYDYLINMLQTIVETLGFYHPCVWWVSHKIRVERENCCDDLAVSLSGDRVRYARALTSMEEIRGGNSELAVTATGGNLFSRIRRLIGKDSIEKTFSWIPAVIVILLLVALIIPTTLALTTNKKYPTAEFITNKSKNKQPENEPPNTEEIDSSKKVLIETQIIHVSNEFLEQVGLDANSLKNSNPWMQYRVDDSSNPFMFVIDSHRKEMLLKIVDESEDSSSISRIFLMATSGREAMIKNNSGYDFKSQELGRFIKIKPELSQDGQSTSLDCELLIRRFENFDLFSDVYINKKVDRNDVSESEIVEYRVNVENALLSNDQTLLILGGKLVSLRDVENRQPILRHIPVSGEFVNTTSKMEGQANEIVLIKTTIVSPEQSDDVNSKALSYNVAKIDEFLRIYLDLDLEAGQYVEIKDIGKRKFILKQVTTDSIGKDVKDFPAYASYIDFEIRSNFDLNLATQRFTRGSLFEHDKWDAYFVSPDTIAGNGYFSPTVLCVCTWRFKIWKHSPLDTVDDTQVSLVAVTIKPNKPQKPSTEVEKVDPNKVVLKLVNPNSQPVVGARVGTYVDWSDIAENPPIWFLRYERNHTAVNVESDELGKVTLEAEELFGSGWTPEGIAPLIAIDEGHYLAGLRELSREDLGTEVILTLQPGCRVRGRVTTATARKHKWSTKTLTVYVNWREHRPCQYSSKQGRFELVLPPGKYEVKIYSDDPDKAVTLPIQIKPGQRELDLTKYIDGTSIPPVIRMDNPAQNEKVEQDKARVKVNCLMAEIWSTAEMDRETIIDIKNLLGFSRLTPGDVLKQAVRATAKIEEANAGQKRVTQEQLDAVVKMLVDKGFIKILMSPTLNVAELQTAQIESDQNSLEVTVKGIKNDLIDLHVKADFSSQVTPVGQEQKPMTSRRSLTDTIRINSGQSIVIGGTSPAPVRADAQASQPSAKEIVCILTASIINPAADEVQSTNQTTINGRCRDSDGRPLVNAQVQVYREDFDRRTMKQIAMGRTDSEGRFSLGSVAPLSEEDHGRRKYMVFVPADGHGPAWKGIFSNTSSLELTTYDSAVVSGSVVTEDSEPVAGAQVWVRGIVPPEATEDPASRANDFHTIAPLPGWSAITEQDGSFHIPGVPAGARVQLFVSHRDYAGSLVHVKPGLDATIEVQPGAAITGRVLYGKTGQTAAGVMVQAQGVENVTIPGGMIKSWGETVTDEQGRYTLESLYDTKYNIWAKAENLTMVALDSFQAREGQTREARDLLFIEGGFITGRVIDEATGRPVKPGKYSDVAIYGPSRPKSGAAVESSDIRDDGSFRIRVAPGRNYIYLRPMEDWGRGKAVVNPASQWINVAEDQTVNVEFKIRKFSKEELDAEAERMRRTEIRISIPKTLDEQKPSVDNQSEDANVRKVYDVADLLVTTCLKPSDLVHHITEHVEPESWYALNKTAHGRITIYPGGQANKLAIVQTPENHSKIERLLEELRRFPDELIKAKTQILIETRILTADDAFMRQIGLDPNSVADSKNWTNYLVHASGDSASFVIDPLHADLLLKAATVHKGNKMIIEPRVLALDGKKIEIQTRDSESYYMLVPPSEPNSLSGESESESNRIKLGTTVRLTPHLTPNGKTVELDFEWERRRLMGVKKHTGPDKRTQMIPQIAFDSIKTLCPVPDGKTLIIAGKKITEQIEVLPKVPFLQDLPLIGILFNSPTKEEQTKNLLILIKPVINPPQTILRYNAEPPPFDPDDPLIKKLEARLKHSAEGKPNH